jgi:DNA-binding XRE family transcriptional regulator
MVEEARVQKEPSLTMKRRCRSSSQPNDRLKQERMQRGWTQADVAGFISLCP